MGSDGDGRRGSAAAAARKPRKRQLVMESSDSEADEFCISTRQNAGGAAAFVGNAGAGGRGDGDQLGEKAVSVSSEKVSELKSTDGDGSEKNKGVELERGSSQPVAKKIRVEAVLGSGSGSSVGAAKGGTGGKMLPRGLPTWRLEKPEVRGGRVLDEKGGVDMKTSSASKVREQVSSLDDKRRRVELQRHEKRTPLRTDQGKSVDSGQQDVIRLQGKRGVLKILPKNDKLVKDTGDGEKKTKVDGEAGDGKILPTNLKVDEKTGDVRIPTKRGVLKLLPKNNGASAKAETNDGKLLPKNIKVDGETGDARILAKNSRVDKDSSDGKILTNKTKLDGELSGPKMLMKNSTVNSETVAEKFQPRSSKADGETNKSYKGYEGKSGALAEFQKQDANGEKRVMVKLVSPITLRKSDPSVVGVSLGQRMKQQNSKQQLKNSSLMNHQQPSLSRKDEDTKSSEHKNLKKRLLEHKGLPGNLSKKAKSKAIDLQGTSGTVLNKLEKKPRGGPRNKLKQDVRNQIKRILLENGWKIELRLRKNKDYEDSVYVSPEGTGYWSITKAYAVYQEQFQNPHDENHIGCSSKINNGASDAISKDDLAMLKKNIVKRRTNKEIYGANKKKPGGSRSRGSKDILANRSSRNKHQNREDGVKIKHQGCGLLVRGSTHNLEDNMEGYIPYEWKRTVYSWMIDLEVISEDAEVKYVNNKRTRAMLEGKITRKGIFCGCCSKILTAAKFELHAGSKEQQPYANIFLEDGRVSLLQCLHDAWEKHARYEKKGFYKIDDAEDEHDDTCAICGDGGDLVCCDHCTSTFHLDCLGIKVTPSLDEHENFQMPPGDWSDFSRLDFSGFYTFILERGDEVISAASVRIHGTDLAEMPFIGTRGMYRHQGMCRRLLSGIESALCSLNVRKLVISAVPEMENAWTTVFGFKPVEPSKKQKIKSVNLLIINGTGLLEKRLLPTGTLDGQTTAKPANAVGSDKADVKMFGEASESVTPVNVSRESDVSNDLEIKCPESSRLLIGNFAGLTIVEKQDQPPAVEENDVKRTLERTSPVSVGDIKLHRLPGVNCGDNMQFMSEADNIQEEKCGEIDGKLIAENTVAEQKCEDKSSSRYSNSDATPATVDPCSYLSNEVGKGENCPSSEVSVGAAPITGTAESNLTSNSPSVHCANQENEKSCAGPADTNAPLVTMDEKPDNHELKTAVADGIQSSMEAKSLEDTTNIVNGTSIDSYIDKDTSEDHSASGVDNGVSDKGSIQQTEIIEDKVGSLSPDLKPPGCKDMLEKLTESKSFMSDTVEMDDAAIKVGMTAESYNEAGVSAPVLDISNAICKVVAKPTQTCGEGQLCVEDVVCSNNRESDLASREPVNA
ncbi:Increased DNA methylation 1 [Dichanthelium oligosanthes]|uniref:Increased DNA methylation 1 n=1 Tax=Dichanthelium oligosanthes TaxID=888268 RepID=A0A1E5W1Q5_9POAL|nr:Increased DNA methylation 1 [Dichanthelium oligosanthes]